MYRIEGTLTGVAAILFNKWTDAAEKSIREGTTGGKFTDEQRSAEAMEKLYQDEQGLFLPAWNLKQSLLAGCAMAGLKEGKKAMGQFIKAMVFPDESPRFNKTAPDFIHEVPGKRPPRTGGACLIKRPALNAGWELTFGLSVIDPRRSADHIKRSLEEAGMLVGLGSWRPEYGRFVISDWRVLQ